MTDAGDRIPAAFPKRWLRFSLRSLFGLVVVAALVATFLARYWQVPVGLDGYCPVTLCDDTRWCEGDPRYAAVYQGRKYYCAGPKQLAYFKGRPDRYSPVASGWDIVLAMDEDRLVAGKRQHGLEYNRQILLFASEKSLEKFARSPRQYTLYAYQNYRQATRNRDRLLPPRPE